MKSTHRLLSILLLLFMLLSFFACAKPAGPEQPTEEPQTTEELPFDLIVNGESRFRIIRPEKADADSVTVKQAIELRRALSKYCTQDITITTDWMKPGESHDKSTMEILLGATNYEESAEVEAEIPGGAWAISRKGNKIVIFSRDEICLKQAVVSFLTLAMNKVETGSDGICNLTLRSEDLNTVGTSSRKAAAIPVPDGTTFYSFFNSGDGVDEVIYENAVREDYDAYLQKLSAAGYEEFERHEIAGVPFAIYTNEDTVLNLGYYDYENRIRITTQKYDDTIWFGAEEDNEYETVTTSLITMLGVQYTRDDGKQENTGACLVVRLKDGRFLIFDGGHNRSDEMSALVRLLKEQSKDYSAQTGGIRIAAWIITHPHGDHWSVLCKQYSQLVSNKITVENILFNGLSEQECQKGGLSYDTSLMRVTARALHSNLVTPHMGNTYYLANVRMETIFTDEAYGPLPFNDLNGISLMFKLNFLDDQGNIENTFMAVGDATGYDFRVAAQLFDDYLKSDICQIAHHGASTKGDDEGTIMGYKLILPETVLWTSGQGAYDAYWDDRHNIVAINKRSNPYFKECFVAGVVGKQTILKIPYTAGTAIVKKN